MHAAWDACSTPSPANASTTHRIRGTPHTVAPHAAAPGHARGAPLGDPQRRRPIATACESAATESSDVAVPVSPGQAKADSARTVGVSRLAPLPELASPWVDDLVTGS